MRVIVADRYPLLRRGIAAALLENHPDWEVSEAATFGEAEHAAAAGADLVLLDAALPELSDIARLGGLLSGEHPPGIMLLADETGPHPTIPECLDCGIRGVVQRTVSPDHLLRVIELVSEGGIYVLNPPVEKWRAAPLSPAGTLPANLTPRQQDVLRLLTQGHTTKEIARKLDLGVGTVKVHLQSVYRVLGAHNRTQAVARTAGAMRH